MERKKILVVGSCFLVLVLLAGCAATSGSRSYGSKVSVVEPLEVSSMLRFNDVPVPAGFTTLDKESFAFQNDVTRVALLKYVGGKSVDEVVAFYKAQMPMYNWSPINIIEYERRIMNYEREGESCIVTVEGKGRKSTVTIAISPKSRPMKVKAEK
ncbi:MAG: hypothetical protein HQ566_03605 [Candidatus Omnitrophica bacterium]|nr:hypothetical protein [Candidatus Omnitrophota bacterium]